MQNCCNGNCSDPQTDSANCGACGTVCPSGQVCSSGACAAACTTSACDAGGCCGKDTNCCVATDVCCYENVGPTTKPVCVDPTTGNCPPPGPAVSRRAAKRDIEYLSEEDLASAEDAVRKIPLARFNYKWDSPNERRRLGFIIEDIAPSPGVDEANGVVDLYGYTSLAVAALQEQAREIAQLRDQINQLQRRLDGAKRPTAKSGAATHGAPSR